MRIGGVCSCFVWRSRVALAGTFAPGGRDETGQAVLVDPLGVAVRCRQGRYTPDNLESRAYQGNNLERLDG